MKKTVRFFLFISLFSLVFIPKIFAQGALEGSLNNQSWQCLETEKLVQNIQDGTVRITTKNINQFNPPGTNVYIVECLSTDTGDRCTTAEEEADRLLFGNIDSLTYLKTENYGRDKFTDADGQPLAQPVQSDMDGKIGPLIWKSGLGPLVGHTFFGVAFIPETVLPGGAPALKLSTFSFQNASEDCKSLRWDPYGRVFDSQSLEPISNVTVTLYSKANPTAPAIFFVLPGIVNSQEVNESGRFNFVIPDGRYILTSAIASHTFPNIESNLHANYYQAYWDIYRKEDIIQAGQMQHRDIPMDPVGIPYRSDVKILDYSAILDKLNSKTLISGSVSHPLSKVRILNGTTLLEEITASNFGYFDISLDTLSIDPVKGLAVEVIKTDLTQSFPQSRLIDYLFTPVYAQKTRTSVKIDPILNNIRGYAYNEAGQPVPFATVSLFLTHSQKAFYQTRADEKGYINIPSQYISPLPYTIQIKSPNGAVNNLTTTLFAALNKIFATENNVNYGTYKPVVETSKPVAKTSDIGRKTEPEIMVGERETVQIADKQAQRKKTLAMIIFTIFFIGLPAGAAYCIYQKKRKVSDTYHKKQEKEIK